MTARLTGTCPATVWVLRIEHQHGEDVFVAREKIRAMDQLADYVHEWWDVDGPGREGASEPDMAQEAIEAYFHIVEDEFWSIEMTEVLE